MQFLINICIDTAVIMHIGLSFSAIYYVTRFFHLAHGAIYIVGAYAGLTVLRLLTDNLQTSPDTSTQILIYGGAVLIAMITSGVVGALIDRIVYRPLRKRSAPSLVFLLVSFGVFIFIQNLVAVIYGNQVRSLRLGPVREGHMFLGASITSIQIVVIMSSLCILFLLLSLKRCRIGNAIHATADDSVLAGIVGIDVEKVFLYMFIFGSALAGFSGVLVSLETNLEPTMGFNILLKGVIASVIGGIGSFAGVLLGALLIGTVENIVISFLPAGCEEAITFGILLFFLILRPQGILGKKDEQAG